MNSKGINNKKREYSEILESIYKAEFLEFDKLPVDKQTSFLDADTIILLQDPEINIPIKNENYKKTGEMNAFENIISYLIKLKNWEKDDMTYINGRKFLEAFYKHICYKYKLPLEQDDKDNEKDSLSDFINNKKIIEVIKAFCERIFFKEAEQFYKEFKKIVKMLKDLGSLYAHDRDPREKKNGFYKIIEKNNEGKEEKDIWIGCNYIASWLYLSEKKISIKKEVLDKRIANLKKENERIEEEELQLKKSIQEQEINKKKGEEAIKELGEKKEELELLQMQVNKLKVEKQINYEDFFKNYVFKFIERDDIYKFLDELDTFNFENLENKKYNYPDKQKCRISFELKNGKLDGKVLSYYKNGNINFEINYKDGRRHGEYKEYYSNKKEKIKMNFIEGMAQGEMEQFYMNGTLKLKAFFKNDKKEGVHKEYYEDGKIKYEVFMKNGMRNGIEKYYYKNEVVQMEVSYKNDIKDGLLKLFDKSNNKLLELPYKEGLEEGKATFYDLKKFVFLGDVFDEDIKKRQSMYRHQPILEEFDIVNAEVPYKAGKIEGEMMLYDKDCVLKKYLYKNDEVEVVYTYKYFDNGNIEMIVPWKNGKVNGEQLEYYENGQLKAKVPLKNEMICGTMEEYDDKGNLESKIEYKNDIKNGISKSYYASGAVQAEVPYKNNMIDGVCKGFYDINEDFKKDSRRDIYGELAKERKFVNNQRHGISKTYNKNGKLILKTNYKNGKKCGDLERFLGNGVRKRIEKYENDKKISAKLYDKYGFLRAIVEYDENGKGFLKKCEKNIDEEKTINSNKIKEIKEYSFESGNKMLTLGIITIPNEGTLISDIKIYYDTNEEKIKIIYIIEDIKCIFKEYDKNGEITLNKEIIFNKKRLKTSKPSKHTKVSVRLYDQNNNLIDEKKSNFYEERETISSRIKSNIDKTLIVDADIKNILFQLGLI